MYTPYTSATNWINEIWLIRSYTECLKKRNRCLQLVENLIFRVVWLIRLRFHEDVHIHGNGCGQLKYVTSNKPEHYKFFGV